MIMIEAMTLRRPLLTTLAAAVLATIVLADPPIGGAQLTARVACSGDVSATIDGKHKCLGVGEYCATRYERQYEHYGFVCSTRYNPPRLRRK
jgi:hypothetical protein